MADPRNITLLKNPDFLTDLRGKAPERSIAKKWGVATGTVNKWRKRVREEDSGGEVLPEDFDQERNGDLKYKIVADCILPLSFWLDRLRDDGFDPDDFTYSIGHSVWTQHTKAQVTKTLYANRFSATLKTARDKAASPQQYDLPALYAAAKARPRRSFTLPPKERATVVVLADPQIGKTGRRGGTPELLDRMAEKREKVSSALIERRPMRTLFADGGDGFENFNSGGNPMFTNDLSLPDQMDVYGTEVYSFLDVMQSHGPVDVMAVLSNHTAWRNGKQNLGLPKDDLGIFVHRQVRKVAEAARIDTTWHFPDDYDESVAVDVLGTSIGLVHGNQFGPGQAVSWWEKQAFGAGAVALADVLITAHYHTFGAGAAGRNPTNGRQRYWVGAPTLDNGSDWFRQTAGRDSDPGLLIFDITPDGFDLSSLAIL